MRVVPEVSGPARAGQPVAIQLRLSTTSDAACTLQLDAAALLVAVTSGDDQVWSSARCPQTVPGRSLVMQPRWSTLVEVTWSGRRGCAAGEGAAVAPGHYTLQAALVAGEPAESYFEIEEPPEPDRRHEEQRDGRQRAQT
jgi:hypothetical protein